MKKFVNYGFPLFKMHRVRNVKFATYPKCLPCVETLIK